MGVLRYLGRNARDSHTAGLVIGAGAVVFNLLWLTVPPPIQGLSPPGPTVTGVLFFLIASLNAYVATRIVWWGFVPADREFSLGRAAVVGLGLGPFSMFTFSAIGLPLLWFLDAILSASGTAVYATDGAGLLSLPISLVYVGLVGTVTGLYLTVGIPIVITTGGALGLAYLEKQYG